MSTSSSLMGTLAVVLTSILWGTTGTAASFAVDLSPLAIGAFAMGGAALLLGLRSARGIRRHLPALRAKPALLFAGALAVAIYPLAFYSSMYLAGVAIGTVVSIASAPLFAALLERILDGKSIETRWVLSFTVGALGMVLLYAGKGGAVDTTQMEYQGAGVALGLLAGLTYALYTWVCKTHIHLGIESSASMAALFLLASVVLLPSLYFTGENLFASVTNTSVVIYMALVPMFLGYLLFGYGLRSVSVSSATLITLLEPVVAVLFAVLLLGERFQLVGWIGLAAILVSLLIQLQPQSSTKL